MGRTKHESRAIVDYLFDFYNQQPTLNCGIANDFIPIDVKENKLTINTSKRIRRLISDSHLLHIIQWIQDRLDIYGVPQLQLMKNEQKYRTHNYIFIPDYK